MNDIGAAHRSGRAKWWEEDQRLFWPGFEKRILSCIRREE
jgi:hypothetical protein